MSVTIQSMKESRKFNKTEAAEFINHAKDTYLVAADVAAYLVGFKWDFKDGEKVLVKNGDARNPKDNFLPRLAALEMFPSMIEKIKPFAATVIESRNKKDETRLYNIIEPMYDIQCSVLSIWREVEIDYWMASNEVIYKELLLDFARFVASFEEIRKYVLKKAKQDKRIEDFYNDIFEGYDPKTEWFSFILEDILTLGASFESTYSGIPVALGNWKKDFYNAHKIKRAEVREMIEDVEKKYKR